MVIAIWFIRALYKSVIVLPVSTIVSMEINSSLYFRRVPHMHIHTSNCVCELKVIIIGWSFINRFIWLFCLRCRRRHHHHHHVVPLAQISLTLSRNILHIVHRLWQVFRTTSRILTEQLNVCSSWSSCFFPAICGGP